MASNTEEIDYEIIYYNWKRKNEYDENLVKKHKRKKEVFQILIILNF